MYQKKLDPVRAKLIYWQKWQELPTPATRI
jgi:hypothetical protein